MNQNGYPKPKIENGFDKRRSVTGRLTFWLQLYFQYESKWFSKT